MVHTKAGKIYRITSKVIQSGNIARIKLAAELAKRHLPPGTTTYHEGSLRRDVHWGTIHKNLDQALKQQIKKPKH